MSNHIPSARFCSILILVLPVFAAPVPSGVMTVVHADAKTGRLVRSVIVKPVASTAVPAVQAVVPKADLTALVDRIASEQGVEESLVHSVIRAESNYNPYAVSSKGAQGMMQLIPATARRFGVTNSFDPRSNVEGGVKYLKFLLDYYKGDYALAIAAYNAGEGAVDKYNGIPPYPETRNYVYQVARNLKTARRKRAATPHTTSENVRIADATAPVETYNPVEASVGSDGRVYYRTP